MGNPLSQEALRAFADELDSIEKSAGFLRQALSLPMAAVRAVSGGTGNALVDTGARLSKGPMRSLHEGWTAMSPKILTRTERAGSGMGIPFTKKRILQAGQHLVGGAPAHGGVRGLAERASRAGWTGKGDITKYLPVGEKGVLAGFTAPGIAELHKGPAATPTGEGAAGERSGSLLGGTGGWVLGAGLGLPASLAMMFGGEYAGKHLGRLIDRTRAGAGPRQLTAPSPQEAQQQLSRISETYG